MSPFSSHRGWPATDTRPFCSYNAPKVRTSVIAPTKVSTQMGDAMKETDNQLWVAPSLLSTSTSPRSDFHTAFAASLPRSKPPGLRVKWSTSSTRAFRATSSLPILLHSSCPSCAPAQIGTAGSSTLYVNFAAVFLVISSTDPR